MVKRILEKKRDFFPVKTLLWHLRILLNFQKLKGRNKYKVVLLSSIMYVSLTRKLLKSYIQIQPYIQRKSEIKFLWNTKFRTLNSLKLLRFFIRIVLKNIHSPEKKKIFYENYIKLNFALCYAPQSYNKKWIIR